MLDQQFYNDRGLILDGSQYQELTPEIKHQLMGMDAQPALGTSPNAGILSVVTTYIDPAIVEYLFAPLKAVDIAGSEVKKGDWLSTSIAFDLVENTGQVATYGDWNENGNNKANVNFPQRQPYTYQIITKWGVQELERQNLMKLDWMNRLNRSSIWTLNQYQNNTYFFGVAGLQNYGLLNDPSLPAPIAPANIGGNILWSSKTAIQIYDDIVALFTQLSSVQANGNIDLETEMTLAVSPYALAQLTHATAFNVNVRTFLSSNFPNMKIVSAPQLATTGGQLVRLKADNVEAQITEQVAFTVKMRTFPVITRESSYTQKKAQGTIGAIIYRPVLVAGMLGV